MIGLGVLAMLAMLLAPRTFATLIFGGPQYQDLTVMAGLALGVVIADNGYTSLYTALRQVRFVSAMQFINSAVFAAVGVGLLLGWRAEALSVLLAYAVACMVTSTLSTWRLGHLWAHLPARGEPLSNVAVWNKLAPFAFSLWLTNCLSNVFGLVDRWMIIHYSGLSAEGGLSLVGQYHTARIFPVLFIGIAELLGAVVTPHLSADWEAGRRMQAAQRLRTIVKLLGLTLLSCSIGVLILAPWLFHYVWQHRYGQGLAVLPWALVACVWTGMTIVSYNYAWCAEKPRYLNMSLAAGLVLNCVGNYLLLPRLGLMGAVLSTAASRLVALALLWAFTARLGMRVDHGSLTVVVLAMSLTLGPWVALVLLAAALLEIVPGLHCFDARERAEIRTRLGHLWDKIRPALARA